MKTVVIFRIRVVCVFVETMVLFYSGQPYTKKAGVPPPGVRTLEVENGARRVQHTVLLAHLKKLARARFWD